MESNVTFLKIIMDVLERVHPNNYEILNSDTLLPTKFTTLDLKEYKEGSNFNILIKYPKLTITNSLGHSHKIVDLFILIQIKNNKLYNFYGFRGTVTFKEYLESYTHSHLNTFSIGNIGGFCLGIGAFNNLVSINKKQEVTSNTFTLFLYSLTKYLEWESIEGVPHAYIFHIDYKKVKLNFTNIQLTDGFKTELCKCVQVHNNTVYGSIDVQIEPSEKLHSLIPDKYKLIKFNEAWHIEKKVPVKATTNTFLFTTDKFNVTHKIIDSDEIVEGVQNQFGASENFILRLETMIATNLNNLLLWRK